MSECCPQRIPSVPGRIGSALSAILLLAAPARAEVSSPGAARVGAETSEAARIALVERLAPAVVAIFDEQERGGGSGVLIDAEGYGLTNYHVVAGMLESRRGLGGLADGKLYPLHVLGIDPGGDVAMFRLTGRDSWPHVPLGDSDAVRVGDEVIAMGNPFMLSEDYTPTVTFGVVSGVNRYQWGAGGGDSLLYSDCIQVDAAINPGNSGGPLFSMASEIIGINGRISVSLRGRVNVGLGYAITANQIKAFLPGLRAGLLMRHGAMQAVARDHHDGSVLFVELLEDGPAWDAGIRPGDTLLRFDGRPIRSANEFASILGTLPADWPVPVTYRNSAGGVVHAVARTEAIDLREADEYEHNADANLDAVERILRLARTNSAGADITANRSDWEIEGDEASPLIEPALATAAAALSPELGREALSHWRHCGADRVVTHSGDTPRASCTLECVEAPLAASASARLLLHPETGRIVRLVATDTVTRETVVLDRRPAATLFQAATAAGWSSDALPPFLADIAARTVKIVGARVGQTVGYGCGIVVSADGLVLTVDSGLLDGRNVRAYLPDGTPCRLAPVRADHDRQLALLRMVADDDTNTSGCAWFDLDAAADPVRGTTVWASGNPFKVAAGAEPVSFARGVLAGTTRLDATRGTQDFPYRGEVLVIDAITSTPGFAGGPLVDADGRLLGMIGRMVEARMTHTMLNYAVPARVLADFVRSATDRAAVSAATAQPPRTAYHGIKFFELGYQANPVYVERVRRDSPAARAGIRKDDLIIGADGKPVPKLEALERIIADFLPGDTLELTVLRGDEVRKFSIVLEEEP